MIALTCPHANSRAVASFWRLWRASINFLQHCIVDFTTKRILDRVKISAMTVRGQLDAIDKPTFQIVHEVICATGVALADKPAGYQLGIGVKRNPCPNVTRSLCFVL